MATIEMKLIELRRDNPDMRARELAERLGIPRTRVYGLLHSLGIAVDQRYTKNVYMPPVTIPTIEEPPDFCPKCGGRKYYREIYVDGWEFICTDCRLVVAQGYQ